MSNWTKEKRDELPLKYFGDPDGRKYPIQDQDDVDSASHLIGKAPEDQQNSIKKRIIAICKELDLDPPKAWVGKSFANGDDLSYNELINALGAALGTDPDHDGDEDFTYVVDVMPSKLAFIYSNDQQLFEQGYTLDADGHVKLNGAPVAVTAVTNYQPQGATLSFFSADSNSVVYEGEIFRSGNYPDKGINATEELLEALAQNTGFAQIKLEHVDTVLDSALKGFGLVSVRKAGNLLFGTVRLPGWMRENLGRAIKVSVGLDLIKRSIRELSLVLDPRVPTAQILAAFTSSRHSMADKADIQKIHDHSVTLGASRD